MTANLSDRSVQSITILVDHHGRPWLTNTFGHGWREACRKAGITGLTFDDLRGTAVARLSLAGCTVPEIAAITGHSLVDVGRILDAHDLHRDPALAAAAIRKLEANILGHIGANRVANRRKIVSDYNEPCPFL